MYFDLVIVATTDTTEIWLGDDHGHLVQMATGTLDTSLLPGNYVVEFGLGTPTYPISLAGHVRYSQAELTTGPSCARPGLKFGPA
jgi:hypothetical protein